MARIRTIKPEFFTSEDVVSMSPLARLLFIALWCEADREGRLEWKPRTFKMRYLPADDCSIDALCREITSAGLLVLYGDGAYGWIPTFGKHQHVNPREADSRLPAPEPETARAPAAVTGAADGMSPACTDTDNVSTDVDACATRADASPRVSDAQVGKERKGSIEKANAFLSEPVVPPGMGPSLLPGDGGGGLVDQVVPLAVLPASGDGVGAGHGGSGVVLARVAGRAGGAAPGGARGAVASASVPDCPVDRLMDLYAQHLPMLPQPRRSLFKVGAGGKAMRQRWRWVMTARHERGERAGQRMAESVDDGLAWFARFFAYAAESDFLTGRSGAWQGCDLAFLVKAEKFERLLSGAYHADSGVAA